MGPFIPTVGAEPIVIRLAVSVLAVILLVATVLIVAASMNTFEAISRIFPDVVANCPDVFIIVLVATRFVKYIEPVEIAPPVLSIDVFNMLNDDTLSATKLLVTFRYEIVSAVVVKFVAFTVSA